MQVRKCRALIKISILLFYLNHQYQMLLVQAAPLSNFEQHHVNVNANGIVSSRRYFEHITPLRPQQQHRQKQQHDDDEENADIIPELDIENNKNLGEQLKEDAETLFDEMKQTWEMMVASLKDCLAEFKRLFSDAEDADLIDDYSFERYEFDSREDYTNIYRINRIKQTR